MAKEVYYSLPFRTERFGKKGSLLKSNLLDSIKQNIFTILISPGHRYRYDPYYGCRLQRYRFLASNRSMEDTGDEAKFKKILRENIHDLLDKYERRILVEEVEVDVQYEDGNLGGNRPKLFAKKMEDIAIKVKVQVKGKIKKEYAFDQPLDISEIISLF